MKQDLVKQDQVMQGLVIHDSVTHDSVMQDQKKQDQVNWRGSASSSKDELCTKVPKWCIANTSCSKFIGNAIHGGLYAFTFSKVKNWFSSCRLESKVESKTKKVKQRKFNHKGNLITDKPFQRTKKNRTMKNWSKVRKENKNRPKNKAKNTKKPQVKRNQYQVTDNQPNQWNLMNMKDMQSFIKHLNYAIVLLDIVKKKSSPHTQACDPKPKYHKKTKFNKNRRERGHQNR